MACIPKYWLSYHKHDGKYISSSAGGFGSDAWRIILIIKMATRRFDSKDAFSSSKCLSFSTRLRVCQHDKGIHSLATIALSLRSITVRPKCDITLPSKRCFTDTYRVTKRPLEKEKGCDSRVSVR
jgi:hypothetical protein